MQLLARLPGLGHRSARKAAIGWVVRMGLALLLIGLAVKLGLPGADATTAQLRALPVAGGLVAELHAGAGLSFTALALLLVVGAALVTSYLGLSPALGAFLAVLRVGDK